MSNIEKPNVLVAGFPKCGSTFLYHVLKQHPDIYIHKIKELNYFNKDHFFISHPEVLNPRYFKPFSWYLNFFKSDKKARIDFSILSALDVASARRVKDSLGDIKVIFITRNKKDFENSMRNFLRREGGNASIIEKYADFEYYIDNYKNHFSKVLVISLEKLNKNPQKELGKITKFLNLKNFKFNVEVPRHETKDYKMGFLQLARRHTYFFIIRLFYKFISMTVRAKLKAQGETR